eukprot:gene37453-46203_t
MDVKTGLFYLFAAVLLFAAFRVITARNPVYAALYLVLAFFQAAAVWILLRAEFLAISLVLVYVGAVMVLFLFVVMMLDIHVAKMREGFWGYLPLAATIGGVIVLEMASVIWRSFGINGAAAPEAANNIGTTKALGMLIYTEYIYAFEIAAAVALTLRKRKDIKYFDPADAVRVKRNDRLRIVKMDPVSTRNAPAAAAAAAATNEAPKEAK